MFEKAEMHVLPKEGKEDQENGERKQQDKIIRRRKEIGKTKEKETRKQRLDMTKLLRNIVE